MAHPPFPLFCVGGAWITLIGSGDYVFVINGGVGAVCIVRICLEHTSPYRPPPKVAWVVGIARVGASLLSAKPIVIESLENLISVKKFQNLTTCTYINNGVQTTTSLYDKTNHAIIVSHSRW